MAEAAFIVSIGSALGTIGAVVVAIIAARDAKRSADSAAELARIERARRADEEAASYRDRVKLKLAEDKNSVFRLYNAGDSSAYGVTLNTGKEAVEISELRGGSLSQPFYLDSRRSLEVSFHREPDSSDPPESAVAVAD